MKSANDSLLPALLGTGLFALLALAFGWLISHPVSLGPLVATPTPLLPTPAITYPPGPYVLLGPSRLGAVTRLDHWPLLSFYGFDELATDGTALVGESTNGFQSVILIDPASRTGQKLTDTGSAPYPQLSDHYVVWTDQYQLHYYDRTARRAAVLKPTDKVRRTAVSGSVVVWENISSPGWKIMGHDFSSGRTFTVSQSIQAESPRISGQWVVYTDRTDQLSGTDGSLYKGVHATNISTTEDISLDHILLGQTKVDPTKYYAIDVPWVVWSSQAIGQRPRLNVLNLDTRRSKIVDMPARCPPYTLPSIPIYLAASGGVVVFEDACGTAGYDMNHDAFFALPLNQHDSPVAFALSYALAKGHLFWSDVFDSHAEIYTAPLLPAP